jgi:predicted peptidase
MLPRVRAAIASLMVASACNRSPPPAEIVVPVSMDTAAAARAMAAINEASAPGLFAYDTLQNGRLVLPFRLLSPPSSTEGGKYPLVLILHGSGGIGTDNVSQLGAFARAWALDAIRARFPAFIAVPQTAERTAVYSGGEHDASRVSTGTPWLDATLALVDTLVQTRAIDASRIYVLGFSMGGSATWNALVRRPGLFAAAMPVSGVPPERRKASLLSGTPILIVHGDADPENPVAADRAMYDALFRAGARTTRFREYRGLDHRVLPEFMTDTTWRSWLFSQQQRR